MNSKLPTLRFSAFSLEWETHSLGDLSDITKLAGFEFTKHIEYSKSGYIIGLRALNIQNNQLQLDNVHYIDNSDFSKLGRSKLFLGDVLFTYVGANIGAAALIDQDDKYYLAPNVCRIRCEKEKLHPKFLHQYITNGRFLNKEIRKHIASSSQPALSMGNIRAFALKVPSFDEQQKIADFLSAVDEKIRLLKEKHALLKQYKKSVMQKLFSQEIRFKDDNNQAFPDWKFRQGNGLFSSVSDKKHNSDLPILAITQEHGAIPRDLINYQVQATDSSVASYKVVNKGDFIISLRSFQGGIEYSQYKGICSPAYIILRPCSEIVDDFYRYYLKTGNFIQEMKRRLEGIRDGKILNYKYFSEIKLPYPCVAEQQKIAEFLQALDEKLAAVQQQIELTQTFKKGLLQQMFV